MARVQTPIIGITTTSAYEEGSCYSLVNLRPKNGALHPVSPRKIVQELSQRYDIVFVHQNNDYKNWIGVVVDANISFVYWNILKPEELNTITPQIPGKINSVQQIGNILSLVTEDRIYYLIYRDHSYYFLGEMPQVPVISFRTYDRTTPNKFYFLDEYESGTITRSNFIDATKGLVYKAMDALVNGYTDKDGIYHGGYGLHLFDACFIRYAFRLYDGTLTKHSPPILIMPRDPIVGSEAEGREESIKSISYDFDETLRDESYVKIYGFRIYMDYDFSGYDNWKDIIQSVDIFMSAPLGISNIENIRTDMPTTDSPNLLKYNLIKGVSPEVLKNIVNTSNFYFVKSIELGSKTYPEEADVIPSKESDISKIENLIFQEAMPLDNFSNHQYGAECSYVHNSRLHLANVKTTFFQGFHPGYFQWTGMYNGVSQSMFTAKYMVSEIDIYTGVSVEKVYSIYNTGSVLPELFASAFISYPDPRAKRVTIYEIYGSNDGSDNDVWKIVFTSSLESHNFLNIAYYLNDSFKPIVTKSSSIVPSPDMSKVIISKEPNKIKVSELNSPLSFPSKNTYSAGNGNIMALATNTMNVSDRNYGQYPLYVFTTSGIWTLNVGSGEIVYSTQTAPTYTEAPTTGIVGETPYGVVFTTQRGLHIINGQSVNFISPQIEQVPLMLNIEMNSHCEGVVFSPEHRKFSELLKGLSSLIYNPNENELIVNLRESEFNYIFNFSNQLFYQSTEKISILVGNAFPELFVVNDTTLKDYASAKSPLTHVSFITRPLQYGTPDIKRMERMILSAILYDVTNPKEDKFSLAMAHYSNDGINFLASKGYPINEGNRRDFDMGLFSRTKSRQFLYVFSGVVDERSQIFNIDTVLDKEYNNSKMR